MELKYFNEIGGIFKEDCSNRTFMELKCNPDGFVVNLLRF